jgi:ADP-ribose pyrophosphatase YjhB (NUDIX family)
MHGLPPYHEPMPDTPPPGAFPIFLGEEPRFCAGCGRAVELELPDGGFPRFVCAEGHITWRNPRVVVGTLPVERGRVYLARRAIEPASGRWTYPGGFLEVGEAAQEGARRETEEETELRVEVGRLVGVYSRPHAAVVTVVYEATVVGGRPEPAAETTEVRDFGPDDIPWDELAFSTVESALRDWIASLPGRGPRFEPELYVEGDPD